MFRYNTLEPPPVNSYTMANQLSANNRWVKLAALIPWDELAQIYRGSFHSKLGAPSVDARVVIGALIIKHKLKLDDRGTIALIQENPYMQYFLGFKAFRFEPVFHPSLFVTIRKRLGAEAFDEMTNELLKKAGGAEKEDQQQDKSNPPAAPPGDADAGDERAEGEQDLDQDGHHGILKLDATVCDQYIKYPTDLDLVGRARWESERLIDILCKVLQIKIKPKTYRIKARLQYLLASKNKKLSKRKRYTAIGQQLRYLKRNLGHLDRLLGLVERIPFAKRDYKIFLVIQHLYAQQYEMWLNKVNRCDHRIVNIYQPHVRPIVRGKAGKNVEFGSKISISLVQGIARLDRLSWEAFNESQILQEQVKAYRATQGCWPEKVVVDHIYGTRENRRWCKQQGIHLQVKPLGRPPTETAAVKSQHIHRNDLEGKFGEGKNGFNLNKIRAKLQRTAESWIAAIFFVMNVNELARRAAVCLWIIAMVLSQVVDYCSRYLGLQSDSDGHLCLLNTLTGNNDPQNFYWDRNNLPKYRTL
jgi:transposase, IS5 family